MSKLPKHVVQTGEDADDPESFTWRPPLPVEESAKADKADKASGKD